MTLPPDFDRKARAGLIAVGAMTELGAEVEKEVDAFFVRNPGCIRTRLTEAFIAGLYLDHLSTPADLDPAKQHSADSQSAIQPPNQKVA